MDRFDLQLKPRELMVLQLVDLASIRLIPDVTPNFISLFLFSFISLISIVLIHLGYFIIFFFFFTFHIGVTLLS